MNEHQWLISKSLPEMLKFLQIQPHLPLALVDRKLLYWIANVLRDYQSSNRAAQLIEEFADGKYTVQKLRNHPDFFSVPGGVGRWLHKNVPLAAQQMVQEFALTPSQGYYDHRARLWINGVDDDRSARPIEYLRELFGNPWAAPNPDWRHFAGGVVQRLADEIELYGAWDLLPILGDALEDAGCTHPDVLEHCRASVQHRRGCWVLDLIRMDE
jgi:hypothetical protein